MIVRGTDLKLASGTLAVPGLDTIARRHFLYRSRPLPRFAKSSVNT
jgi:hypothetical protein